MEKYSCRIIKIGNSLGVTLPKRDLDISDLKKGDWVKITMEKIR